MGDFKSDRPETHLLPTEVKTNSKDLRKKKLLKKYLKIRTQAGERLTTEGLDSLTI